MAFDLKSAKPVEDSKFDIKSAKAVDDEGPGWFMPGSKSEAAVRGFSQAATFGFGDEIQAAIRALVNQEKGEKLTDTYARLRDEERGGNQRAAQDQTGAYIGGSILAAIPQAANIASVARAGAPIAGSVAAGQAARALGAGATYGAAQGAGNAETMGDVPAEAAKTAAFQGLLSAVVPAAGAGLAKLGANAASKAAPAAKQAAESLPAGITRNKAGNLVNEAGEVVNRLGRRIAGPEWANVSKPAAMARGETLAQGSAPVIGGVIGASGDTKATDPVDAMIERGKNAAAGAALGWGAGRIPQATRVAGQLAGRTATVAGPLATTQTAQTAGQAIASQPFRKIADYISSAQGATNPQVMEDAQQLQQVSEGADDSTRRKAAMAAQLSPNGRAVTNSTSPKRDEEE